MARIRYQPTQDKKYRGKENAVPCIVGHLKNELIKAAYTRDIPGKAIITVSNQAKQIEADAAVNAFL